MRPRRVSLQRRSHRIQLARTNSVEWHETMGAAPDPNGFIARRFNLRTWDDVHGACVELMAKWERMPERVRVDYAFPNPEDR